jgi:hypothetical protein
VGVQSSQRPPETTANYGKLPKLRHCFWHQHRYELSLNISFIIRNHHSCMDADFAIRMYSLSSTSNGWRPFFHHFPSKPESAKLIVKLYRWCQNISSYTLGEFALVRGHPKSSIWCNDFETDRKGGCLARGVPDVIILAKQTQTTAATAPTPTTISICNCPESSHTWL